MYEGVLFFLVKMAVFASAALMLLVGPTLVRGEGIRYARIPGSRNWRQSRAACAAAGGRLPVILDAPANARVTNFMGESGIGHAHIGLIDISTAQPAPRIWQWCVLLACTLFTGWVLGQAQVLGAGQIAGKHPIADHSQEGCPSAV